MTLTRVNAETSIVNATSKWLSAAGLATTTVGTNADLNDPMAYALTQLGIEPASYVLVADEDFTALAPADYPAFFDLAELRVYIACQGNLALVDLRTGPHDERFSQFSDQLQAIIDRKSDMIDKSYTFASNEISAGVINYNFTERLDANSE